MDKLRRPDDCEVIGDSRYLGMEKRYSANPEHLTHMATKRYNQRQCSRQRELVPSSIRCKAEHAFHRIKVPLEYKKVRDRGPAKNTARLPMLTSIPNMFAGDCFVNRSKRISVAFGRKLTV